MQANISQALPVTVEDAGNQRSSSEELPGMCDGEIRFPEGQGCLIF